MQESPVAAASMTETGKSKAEEAISREKLSSPDAPETEGAPDSSKTFPADPSLARCADVTAGGQQQGRIEQSAVSDYARPYEKAPSQCFP